VYLYLLGDLRIDQPNQAWASDITFIPMKRGFVYLVAVLDWATGKVLSHRLSISMTSDFCVEALEEAIAKYGPPRIFQYRQGSQFTSEQFTQVLKVNHIQISMDVARVDGWTTCSSSVCGGA
jgi:putative transposase